MYTKTITPVTLTINKYLRLVEMQIFIFSVKELEVRNSVAVAEMLFVFKPFHSLWQSLD